MQVRIKKIWDDDKRDKLFGRCIGLYIAIDELNSVLQNVFGFSGNLLSISKVILAVLSLVIIARCLLHLKRNEMVRFAIAELYVLSLYLYSFLMGVNISLLSDWGITSIGVCVPLGIIAYSVKDKRVLETQLFNISWIILVLLLIDTMGKSTKMYDIHFSYIFMFVIILHLSQLFRARNPVLLFIIIAETVIVLMYGSRGGLVAAAFYLCIKFILTDMQLIKKLFSVSLVLLITLLIQYLLDAYGYRILELFQGIGFNSRSLRLLLKGDFTQHDSGRNIVWANSLELINEQPLTGWGIRGAAERLRHPYPHNFFLDFWLSFGYILGSILMIISIYPMRKMYRIRFLPSRDLVLIFFSASMVSLMFSGTWFTNYYYYILMGLLLSERKKRERVKTLNVKKNHRSEQINARILYC